MNLKSVLLIILLIGGITKIQRVQRNAMRKMVQITLQDNLRNGWYFF